MTNTDWENEIRLPGSGYRWKRWQALLKTAVLTLAPFTRIIGLDLTAARSENGCPVVVKVINLENRDLPAAIQLEQRRVF